MTMVHRKTLLYITGSPGSRKVGTLKFVKYSDFSPQKIIDLPERYSEVELLTLSLTVFIAEMSKEKIR